MADNISTIPSELEVGVFSDNLLSTQLDTLERVQSLYSDFNVPDIQHSPIPTVPKDMSTDDLLKTKGMSMNDFLTSTDPKLNEIAKNYMSQDAARNKALTKGYGLDHLVKYQEGQDKYTTDHWWSEAGKTKFGFNPYATLAENDDFYHKNVWNNYSLFGKIWRGTGTFAGRALSKIVTGLVGMVGDIGAMAWNGMEELNESLGGQQNNFWADVSDNWLARKMEDADNYTKEQILPTYRSINYDDKGAFAKLTDPTFWMNDLADGAGFLLQFAVPGTLFGKAAVLGKAGKLGRFGKLMSAGVGEATTASRLARGTGAGLEFLTGSRNVGGITAHVFNTTMESVAETKEGFNATVKELVEKGYSEHEAKQIAAENAPFQFGTNMGILSFSNAFENKWFQQAVGNRINPFRSKINAAGLIENKTGNLVGKFFTDNKWGNRLYYYGMNGAKAAVMEGYWEENAQLAAQRVARGEYERKGEDTPSQGYTEKATNFFSQLMKQTVDSAKGKDREAADSIMAGVVIGVLGGGLFSKFSGSRKIPQVDADGNPLMNNGLRVTKTSFLPEGQRRRENREHAETVAAVKNARDAWMSINTMPIDIYNEDKTINEEKAQRRVDELNEKLSKVASVSNRRITLDQLTDPTERENKQYLLFGDFLKAHILNGTGEDLIERIKNWGNKSEDELAMYGVDPEIAENPLHWANVAQTLYNEYKNIDGIKFVNPVNEKTGKRETTDAYFQKERAIKSLIFDYTAQREASKMTAARYAELEAENNPFRSVDTFNSYNALIARRNALDYTLKQDNLDPDSKDFFQKDLDKVNAQIEMRKNSLPEHVTGNISDMVFEKDSDIATQEREIMESINDYLGYQMGKEDFLRAVEAHDKLIKEYSDPNTGIQKYNEVVDYWADKLSKTRLAKLVDLGYTEAQVTNMTEEQQQKAIDSGLTREQAEQQAANPPATPKEEEESTTLGRIMNLVSKAGMDAWNGMKDFVRSKLNLDPDVASLDEIKEAAQQKMDENNTPSKDDIRKQLLAALKEIDERYTDENLDAAAAQLAVAIQQSPEGFPQNLRDLVTLFVQSKVEDVKKGDPEADSKTEKQPATDVNAVPKVDEQAKDVVPEVTPEPEDNDLEITPTPTVEASPTVTVEVPDVRTNVMPSTLLDEVREAYRLHQQALENETTFKEEAEKEDMKVHNNRIDYHSDEGKFTGNINVNTSNPRDLVDGNLKTADNNLARFNFTDNLLTGKLDSNDFKIRLTLSQNDVIVGIVADKQGNPLSFNDKGMPVKEGLPILMYIDMEMYEKANLGKRRQDVVKPPFPLAPLMTFINPLTGKTALYNLPQGGKMGSERTFVNPPIELHPSFAEKDVMSMLKDSIRKGTVTASISFLTQGMLYREGTDNSYSNIPKNAPTKSAQDLWEKGHLRDERGEIPLEDTIMNGVYRRAQRIQFRLLSNINDRNGGSESAEFHALPLGEVTNEKGEKIWDLLKAENGQNFFEAAIQGNLEATKENLTTLNALLRPDKFLVLNLGRLGNGNLLVINLKKFKKFLNTPDVTPEQLRELTTVDDLKNSELNFSKIFYDLDDEVELAQGVLGDGRNNYMRFVNRNVMTSASTIKKGNIEGYSRINKRIGLSLDMNMDDLNKAENQREQENKAPKLTEVTIEDDMNDKQKSDLLFSKHEEEENFDDDFTKTDC